MFVMSYNFGTDCIVLRSLRDKINFPTLSNLSKSKNFRVVMQSAWNEFKGINRFHYEWELWGSSGMVQRKGGPMRSSESLKLWIDSIPVVVLFVRIFLVPGNWEGSLMMVLNYATFSVTSSRVAFFTVWGVSQWEFPVLPLCWLSFTW